MDGKYRTTCAKAALLLVAVIWGSSLTVVKSSTDMIPPNFLLVLRFTIACAVLSVLFRRKLTLIDREYLKSGAVIGFCLFLAYCSQTVGVTSAMPGKSSFLSASYCVIVPFLCRFTENRIPTKYNVISAVLCVTGIALSVFSEGIALSLGDGLAVLSAFLFAAHIASVSKMGKGKDPVLITILQFFFAALCSLAVSVLSEPLSSTVLTPASASGVLYLALACTALSLLLQNVGQKYTDPSNASLILSLESVFGVIFGVIFFQEKLNSALIAGFILIFAAIVISETELKLTHHETAES